jgi:ABC-type multidrug transport system fused ATPase/permease subunit
VYAAVVGDAEMLLLDDPLSAVDAHVGAHIFDSCINKLLRSRNLTVIMPVHNLQFLQHADHIVCLHQTDGTITEQGRYTDLIQAGGEFAEMMQTFASVSKDDDETPPTTPTAADEPEDKEKKKKKEEKVPDGGTVGNEATEEKKHEKDKKKKKDGKLMTIEERAVGSVDRGVWLYYATACGLALSWIVFFCYIGGMGAKVLTDWWMSRWSVADTSVLIGYEASWTLVDQTIGFLSVYGLLGVFVVVLNGIKTVVVCVIGLKAARTLHTNMLESLLRAPTSFFDQTPVGRECCCRHCHFPFVHLEIAGICGLRSTPGTAVQAFHGCASIDYPGC